MKISLTISLILIRTLVLKSKTENFIIMWPHTSELDSVIKFQPSAYGWPVLLGFWTITLMLTLIVTKTIHFLIY